MNIDVGSMLKDLFPKWRLNEREIVWLWMKVRDQGLKLPLKEFGAKNMCDCMADFIKRERQIGNFEEARNILMLRDEDLQWIEKGERQAKWLTDEFFFETKIRRPECPAHLLPREILIATIDYWSAPLSEKRNLLGFLRKDWGRHLGEDKNYEWFKENEEKKKCEAAWDWYEKMHPRLTRRGDRFNTYQGLLLFLDSSDFRLDEKRLHVTEIRKEYKRRQVSANQKGTKQSNFALPEDVRAQLDVLAKELGITRKEVVERLIRHAAQNGFPKISH